MTEPPDVDKWTDFTSSDPGITVVQLFAYLVEALVGLALVAAWWRCGQRARATVGRQP